MISPPFPEPAASQLGNSTPLPMEVKPPPCAQAGQKSHAHTPSPPSADSGYPNPGPLSLKVTFELGRNSSRTILPSSLTAYSIPTHDRGTLMLPGFLAMTAVASA
jgi:hypothetical protein